MRIGDFCKGILFAGAVCAAFQSCGCCNSSINPVAAPESGLEWFPSRANHGAGVVLVAPGLNNKPTVMAPLIQALTGAGFSAALLTFAAHERNDALKHSATAEKWGKQMGEFYRAAECSHPGEKLFGLGYSMGAAVMTAFLDAGALQALPGKEGRCGAKRPAFDAMFFLAPALTPRASTFPLRLLSHLAPLRLSVPSFAPPETRRYASTSLTSYRALFETVDAIEHLRHPGALNAIPTKIFIRPDDELVSPSRTRDWLQRNRLNNWHLEELRGSVPSGRYAHMLIDRESFERQQWEKMVEDIVTFFK